jgi:hypothetical protein
MTRAQQLIFAQRLSSLKASGYRIADPALCSRLAEEVVRDNPSAPRGTATMSNHPFDKAKNTPTLEKRDRPAAPREADVTPEMIAAGVSALAPNEVLPFERVDQVVTRVY